ncbi:MAG: radical SAM protein [Candidatus Nezhaarchaeota archaeon]|nr:radical SAM protein [Candidatus Nezhaarchaeota archaeon]
MAEYVVNASSIVSPLCHSVLKLEPYGSCSFKCSYCYSRWYLGEEGFSAEVQPRRRVVEGFESLAKQIYKRGLRPMPFRLSTLTDPLPPHELAYKLSLKLLKVAKRLAYPVVLNTKSSLVAEEPWIRLLASLAEEGLALVQISIATFSNEASRALEPSSPLPTARLSAAKKLAEAGVPVAVRLSPFIPYVSPGPEEGVGVLLEQGVKHVIVEALRLESTRLPEFLRSLAGVSLDLEAYSVKEAEGLGPISRVSRAFLKPIYKAYAEALRKRGVGFATCKEGMFDLHTAKDCCGFYLLENYARRLTLWDVYRHVASRGPVRVEEVPSGVSIGEEVLCGEGLKEYPRRLSKPLRHHEKRLLKVLSSEEVLRRVSPALVVRDRVISLGRGPALA